MTLTLLLDLDDTLLSNDIDTFLPAYLRALGRHLIDVVAPDKMTRHLLAGTARMIANDDPRVTLEQAFDSVFYPAIENSKEQMRGLLEAFYNDHFPQLQPLTAQRDAAIRLVDWAISRGHSVVVATNPIFPRQAILHRLAWAGLDPKRVPFALITDYERFHFAKPNPAFFTEILAQLGWPSQPAVVVGNSLTDDLVPAAQLGLPVFWVGEQEQALPDGYPPHSASGTLAQVIDWIEQVDRAGIRQEFQTPKAMLSALKATPAALDTLRKQLTPRQWNERPAPGEWNLTEIIRHMQDVDLEVNIPRLEKVVKEEMPFIAGINTDSWAEERGYAAMDGPAGLLGFLDARIRLIRQMEALAEDDWQRIARHAIFGPTRLQELVSFIITHDQSHLQQVYSAAAALNG